MAGRSVFLTSIIRAVCGGRECFRLQKASESKSKRLRRTGSEKRMKEDKKGRKFTGEGPELISCGEEIDKKRK